ncbi:MAG: hypothetical protein GY868_06540 [Deltaproteobacteria bacterium]|nr:hypothetical protein [Deltaproteobacteria bacterium]
MRNNFLKHNQGQAMVEYAIVAAGVVLGVLFINALIIPQLNDYYELIANIVRLPAP